MYGPNASAQFAVEGAIMDCGRCGRHTTKLLDPLNDMKQIELKFCTNHFEVHAAADRARWRKWQKKTDYSASTNNTL